MFEFGLEVVIQEDHKKPVWCIKFCNILPPFSNYFATVGQNLASVYRIGDKDTVEVVQKYIDEDSGENLFTCAWADVGNGKPLLVVAGIRGILKVLNAVSFELEIVLRGHGNDIDDLCVHPVDTNLVLSASKDESIRLWNIKTSTCIAIFAGEGGHRDDVLSIDIHPLGNCFVSGGMDTSVKIWNLVAPEVQTAVLKSYSHGSILPFETSHQQFPIFSSTLLHKDYVDAVAWVGNLILSKSTSNRAALWAPDPARYNISPCVLRELRLQDSDIWYIRFGISLPLDLVAFGNSSGKVCIYTLSPGGEISDSEDDHDDGRALNHGTTHGNDPSAPLDGNTSIMSSPRSFKVERFECGDENCPSVILSHEDESSIIRYVTFSPEGDYLAYCCDNGKLYIWSITPKSL